MSDRVTSRGWLVSRRVGGVPLVCGSAAVCLALLLLAAGRPLAPLLVILLVSGVGFTVFGAAIFWAFEAGKQTDRRIARALAGIRIPAVLTPRSAGQGRRLLNEISSHPDTAHGDAGATVEELAQLLTDERESLLLATSGADDGLFDINLDAGTALFSARADDILMSFDPEGAPNLRSLLRAMAPADRAAFAKALKRFLAPGGGVFEQEVVLSSDDPIDAEGSDPDGDLKPRWLRFRAAAFRDAEGRARRIAGAVQDITVQKRAEAERIRSAFVDPITGLANRARFLDDLETLVRSQSGSGRVRAGEAGLWLATIDIDRFRRVNDALGQEAGDAMLASIGARLAVEASVQGGIAARLGGDLFGFALLRPRTDLAVSEEAAAQDFGVQLTQLFDSPFDVDGVPIHPSVCVGIVCARDGQRADDLLGEASQALAVAKARGRGQVAVGDRNETAPFMADGALLVLEADLRRAIAEGALHVCYQPIIGAADGGLSGVEALVRWDHPAHGLMLPDVFVSLAEETDLVVEMGRLVLDRALADLACWHRRLECEDLFVAVNLSRRQLSDPDLVSGIRAAIDRHGVSPGCIKLEITESLVMEGGKKIPETLHALRDIGVSLAIDDFGTGHSSLSLLAGLPFDTLKIDRAFLTDVRTGKPRAEALLRGVVALAHRIGMDVVVEGIETGQEAALMLALDVAYCQGFFYGRPVDADQIKVGFSRPPAHAIGI